LLVHGLNENRGLGPATAAYWHVRTRRALQAEAERRADLHEPGAAAATLAGAMARGEDGAQVSEAVGELARRIRLPASARQLARGPVPLLSALGQIAETVSKDVDASHPLRLIADALTGKLDAMPATIVRDLQNEAAKHRRRILRPEQVAEVEVVGRPELRPDKLSALTAVVREAEAAEKLPPRSRERRLKPLRDALRGRPRPYRRRK
jgi:hypothetical protein